jgi:Trp operon repressor
VEHLTSQLEHLAWRRDKIQELSSKGHSQREIASMLQIGVGSVNRDLTYLKQNAKDNIRQYIEERLP